MPIAVTRAVSPAITRCALSFLEREPIDFELALCQHREYESRLESHGLQVISLPAEPDLPDSVFVEDTAVVVEEVAVMTVPALETRQPEVRSVATVLETYRPLRAITGRGRLEGGDVMRIGRTVFVGLSRRTNDDGAAQLAAILRPYGYRVVPIEVESCLHLKTACTYVGRETILANPEWVDTRQLEGFDIVDIAPEEPEAGNALAIGGTLLFPASFPRTRERLEARGFEVRTIDVSELQKAEAGLTCCSIIFEENG